MTLPKVIPDNQVSSPNDTTQSNTFSDVDHSLDLPASFNDSVNQPSTNNRKDTPVFNALLQSASNLATSISVPGTPATDNNVATPTSTDQNTPTDQITMQKNTDTPNSVDQITPTDKTTLHNNNIASPTVTSQAIVAIGPPSSTGQPRQIKIKSNLPSQPKIRSFMAKIDQPPAKKQKRKRSSSTSGELHPHNLPTDPTSTSDILRSILSDVDNTIQTLSNPTEFISSTSMPNLHLDTAFLDNATPPATIKDGASNITNTSIPKIIISDAPNPDLTSVGLNNVTTGLSPRINLLCNQLSTGFGTLSVTNDTIDTNADNNPVNMSRLNTPFISLQDQAEGPEIIPSALDPWRKARSYLSADAKFRVRALHLKNLAENQLLPSWTLGLAPVPGYLDTAISELVRYRSIQAQELLRIASTALSNKATEYRTTGAAYKATVANVYGNDALGLDAAQSKLKQLVKRDAQICHDTLASRTEELRRNPTTDDMIKESLTYRPTPVPPTRRGGRQTGRGRPPTRGNNTSVRFNNTTQNDRARGRGRSPRRGRGIPQRSRSRGRARGYNPATRSRSPSYNRGRSNSRDRWTDYYDFSNDQYNFAPPTRPRGRGRGRGNNFSSMRPYNLRPAEWKLVSNMRSEYDDYGY